MFTYSVINHLFNDTINTNIVQIPNVMVNGKPSFTLLLPSLLCIKKLKNNCFGSFILKK